MRSVPEFAGRQAVEFRAHLCHASGYGHAAAAMCVQHPQRKGVFRQMACRVQGPAIRRAHTPGCGGGPLMDCLGEGHRPAVCACRARLCRRRTCPRRSGTAGPRRGQALRRQGRMAAAPPAVQGGQGLGQGRGGQEGNSHVKLQRSEVEHRQDCCEAPLQGWRTSTVRPTPATCNGAMNHMSMVLRIRPTASPSMANASPGATTMTG